MLPKAQQVLVQTTFAVIESNAESFTRTFYGHLFERDPSLRTLFSKNLKEQGDALFQMLLIAVGGLDHPADVIPALHDLGLHHAGYGVQPRDYDTFGKALLQTVAETLAADFTPEVAAAWETFYKFLSTNAIAGREE